MAFLSFQGLENFKGKLDEIYGAKIVVSGTTVSLVSKAGETLATGTVTVPTYSNATQTVSGLMSGNDKQKLDGISIGATKTAASGTNGKIMIDGVPVTVYTHPTGTAHDSGFYKLTIDGSGHVTAVTAVSKSDITGLGIPAQDTTYTAATTSAAGLMTAVDKQKLNGVSAGAQVNVIESVKVNGTALSVGGKAVNIDLSGYALKTDISQAINYKGSVEKYADLPTSAKSGDMYNVEKEDSAHGISAGENVIWNGTTWDALGASFAVQEITAEQIDSLFA